MKAVDSQLNTPLECGIDFRAAGTPLAAGLPIGPNTGPKEEKRRKIHQLVFNSRLGQVTNGYSEEED
jgi:hypothetical protein